MAEAIKIGQVDQEPPKLKIFDPNREISPEIIQKRITAYRRTILRVANDESLSEAEKGAKLGYSFLRATETRQYDGINGRKVLISELSKLLEQADIKYPDGNASQLLSGFISELGAAELLYSSVHEQGGRVVYPNILDDLRNMTDWKVEAGIDKELIIQVKSFSPKVERIDMGGQSFTDIELIKSPR